MCPSTKVLKKWLISYVTAGRNSYEVIVYLLYTYQNRLNIPKYCHILSVKGNLLMCLLADWLMDMNMQVQYIVLHIKPMSADMQ